MDVKFLSRQLDSMRQRIASLNRNGRSSDGNGLELDVALEELGSALEELHATEQHLREQNENLAAGQRELERERQRYKELFEFAPHGYLTTDLTGIIREANQAAALLFQTSLQNLIGWPMIVRLPRFERERFLNQLTRLKLCAGGETLNDWEIRLQPADGRLVHVACTVACARGVDDRLVGFRWLLRNVSERKRADDALRREKEFAEGLVRTARAAVLVLGHGGRILRTNPYLQTLSGYAAAELEGQNWLRLLVPEADRLRLGDLVNALASGQPGVPEKTPLLARDGTRYTMHWTGSALSYPGEHAVLLVGHDITDLEEAQRRALQAGRLAAIGQMVAGLAHESRNALQRAHACLEMLTLELRDNHRALHLLERVQESQNHVTHLYGEVRQFAAPILLDRQPYRLEDIWRQAWEVLDLERQGRQSSLREEGSGGELVGQFDVLRLRQVFRNVFENALAACTDPVQIVVTCFPTLLDSRPAVHVAVRDNGPGLNEEQRRRIFEPFYTTKIKGTGLGMAIARSNVEAHGGALLVGDSAVSGTEIVVLLPLEES